MREIEVDDEVFEILQSLAEPFVDTPNSVIKKLLQAKGLVKGQGLIQQAQMGLTSKPSARYGGGLVSGAMNVKKRAKTGEVTSQSVYEDWLLKTLYRDCDGGALKAEVTEIVIHKMQEAKILKEIDFERVSTGEPRASNTIAWARNALKDKGLIKSDSPRGVWELTDAGVKTAKELLQG